MSGLSGRHTGDRGSSFAFQRTNFCIVIPGYANFTLDTFENPQKVRNLDVLTDKLP